MKHFHTFDALRFFAFFLVFLQHLPHNDNLVINFFMHSGGVGVQLFFILSGFLISYLLLEEKKRNSTLNFKNFFMRRVLRIWPLYYAMVLFAFVSPYILNLFSLPSSDEGYEPNWFFPFFFLENYEMMLKDSFANVSPLRVMWSLCIEEHFYILWGIVFYFMSSNKKFIYFLLVTIMLSFVFRIIYKMNGISNLDINTNVLYFSFGGIIAYLLMYKKHLIEKLGKIPVSIKRILVGFFVLIYFLNTNLKIDRIIIEPLIIGMITLLLIGFTLCIKQPFRIKDSNIMSRLGKYTYGMYLFHTIWISLIIKFTSNFGLVFILSLAATIISSVISYNLYEKQFLKLKKYFRD